MALVTPMRRYFLLSVLCLAAISASCAPRRLVAPAEVEWAHATLDWMSERCPLAGNTRAQAVAQRVMKRLASSVYGAALEREIADAPAELFIDFPWQVYVLNCSEPLAVSPGAGIVIISAGLFQETGAEAELAAIISHEMAHTILGHTSEALRKEGLSANGPKFAFALKDEVAADALSVKIMKVARYDLRYALSALSIAYRQVNGQSYPVPPDWLTTRMAYLRRAIERNEPFLPATQTTREFNRARSSLSH